MGLGGWNDQRYMYMYFNVFYMSMCILVNVRFEWLALSNGDLEWNIKFGVMEC